MKSCDASKTQSTQKQRKLWNEFLKVCRPVTRLTGSEWADKYRKIPLSTSAEPGQWRTSRTPYLKEPMDKATDRLTEKIVLMCASQLGKSEMCLNLIGYFADQEPAPQLMLQPTVEMAEAFSKERIGPMFRESPGLKGKLEEGKDGRSSAKKSSTTILMKHYPGGYLAMVGANSPAGLASRPIRVMLADEVDRYPASAGKEGDPLKLATQRTANFANRKIILVSTPTIKGISRIHEEFEKGDRREFFVKCPECGAFHVLEWANVRFERDENGDAVEESIGLFCPECGAKIRGPRKISPSVLATGEWRAQNPKGAFPSYHINALYSPWVNLSDLVNEWVDVNRKKEKAGLMEFINLKLGEPWEEYGEDKDQWEYLLRRREFYPDGSLPQGVLLLTAGVDVQHDRLECSVYGWGLGKECWGIRHVVIPGRPDDRETWQRLDGVLFSQFPTSQGVTLTVSCTCIDAGDGVFSKEVYEYTKARERMRIFSVKGRGGTGIPFIGMPTHSNVVGAKLYTLGVDAGKTAVTGRLSIASEGPGFVHYAMQSEAGFGENFFKQLTAEVWEQRYEKGRIKAGWRKIRERNEALDCAVYASAAMELLTPNFDYLAQCFGNAARNQAQQKRTTPRRIEGF